MVIKQDARLYQLILEADKDARLSASASRTYYVHVIEGELKIDNQIVKPGDGATIEVVDELQLIALNQKVRALVFDLP